MHFRPYGLKCKKKTTTRGPGRSPGPLIASQAVRPEMQYTIHTFSFGKRKSVAKRKSTWNLGRKAQIPLLPFGQNNRKMFLRGVQLPVHFMVVHHEICSQNHFGVFSATFHWKIAVRSQLLDSTPMHPVKVSLSCKYMCLAGFNIIVFPLSSCVN